MPSKRTCILFVTALSTVAALFLVRSQAEYCRLCGALRSSVGLKWLDVRWAVSSIDTPMSKALEPLDPHTHEWVPLYDDSYALDAAMPAIHFISPGVGHRLTHFYRLVNDSRLFREMGAYDPDLAVRAARYMLAERAETQSSYDLYQTLKHRIDWHDPTRSPEFLDVCGQLGLSPSERTHLEKSEQLPGR